MAGQTINDRLLAARHSLAGQGLAKSVCKATTEEMIGPKKKHLDYLVHCTNEPNVSIPHLANLLIERSQNANWIVVYKALLTVHHLLAYGNERFMQYLASSNSTFNLSNFLDKGGVQGAVGARIGYDMSPFIRRYAKYLNDKALSYRTVAFDFCKVKRGKEEGSLRAMNADKLLKTLPVLQAQLDGLLEFDCQANDLSNGVINMCFMLLFRDLIRLFACYNDGIINLLEKYFDMNKKQCKDALDLYKKFLVRMDKVGEFLKVAENVGIDKGDIPDLTKAPSSLLDALEGHLASLEGRKGSAANTPTQTSSNQKNVKSGVSALSSTSSSFGTAAASTRFDTHTNGIDESVKAQALAEEEAAMNQYKQQSKLTSPTGSITATNPFLSSPTNSQANIVDLFQSSNQQDHGHAQTKASDDLLQLGNPFADMFSGGGGAGAAGPQIQQQQDQQQTNMWMSNGFNGTTQTTQMGGASSTNTFVSDSNFSSVFGATEPAGSYYLQAAMMDQSTMPNPFLNDPQAHPKISDVNQLQKIKSSGPPQRPPPPGQSAGVGGGGVGGNQAIASPAHSITAANVVPLPTATAIVQPNKSAFDDLNESIRMQLGGSPAKQSMCSSPSLMQQQQQQQQMSGYGGMMQQPIYSSPAKQSMMPGGIGDGGGGSGVGGFDALGDVLKPSSGSVQTTSINSNTIQSGNILASGGGGGGGQHQHQQQHQQQNLSNSTGTGTGKVLTGDLDSSLASLAENLTINKSASAQVKGVQWNSPKNTAKPGSGGWSPQPMAATTGAGYRPMAQGMTVSPAPSTLHHPYVHASYPAMTPYLPQQGMPIRPGMMTGGGPGGVPMAAASGMTMMAGAGGGMPTQQMGGLMSGGGGGGGIQPQQQMMLPQSQQIGTVDQNGKNIQLDPFGAF